MKASEHGGNVPQTVGGIGYTKTRDDVWFDSTTSEQDAIESLSELDDDRNGNPDDVIGYVGNLVEQDVPSIDADWILENLNDQMCSEGSAEAVDDWPSASRDQLEELESQLNSTLAQWLTNHRLWPDWCSLENIRPVLRKQVSTKP